MMNPALSNIANALLEVYGPQLSGRPWRERVEFCLHQASRTNNLKDINAWGELSQWYLDRLFRNDVVPSSS